VPQNNIVFSGPILQLRVKKRKREGVSRERLREILEEKQKMLKNGG